MRVARQHPYLPVPSRTTTTTTANNGKLVVLFNGNQDVVHQQLPPQSPPQSPPQVLQQPQQQHQPTGDENSAVVPPSCVFPSCESAPTDLQGGPTILMDRFLLLGPAEGSALYRCVDVHSGQKLVAKALTKGDKGCEALLRAHLRLEGTGAASNAVGVVEAPGGRRYLLLEGHHGDLHAYVRARRRLREPEARRLFRQAAKAVATCHDYGVVLRDLKLRKFVFADEARTRLRLESLEDAVIVENDDDELTDRRGCPAYVAPEVLRAGRAYSGKAADIWSLGVLLYTMLVGRYPFNDAQHASLFAKISRGQFAVPEGLSPRAKCLIRSLLRKEPSERPYAEDVQLHPWLSKPLRLCTTFGSRSSCQDQLVPELPTNPQQD
ncbi:tribbles homolog 2 [Pseudomyrmex gracilis]|uniref:tribbles homolog 2 n=1 Tax=Pseudomyrmex gracilis TaxID=219809 RepID=UPI00099567D4|nr:tribbles homolog 2 [Pseudomyrmex gracilis]XP_020284992.1 tribbles homolog 2 [Pseudomyrmex gracilis]XP_020284993.1 tribbles homolog 2 [Pseudomyrmex gracilis]XP_020284994.1 tribbles homolog 2 [Pseudomyrmex gracilis]XP_020284995.1 tribbles homolog 2 [Pseudomyrmex gracilis]XP_020284996.1 tribbles homolog 2 [Pseudomyrmex gracilis]